MNSKRLKFQDVYGEFHERIYNYLRQLVGEDDADDITQEVFVKIDKGLGGFQGKSKLSTWIYRIATNTALDWMRSASFRQRNREISVSGSYDKGDRLMEDQDASTKRGKLSVDEQVVKIEMTECIREFIDELPPDYRTVIVLSELRDMKNKEIAEILGVSLNTVKIRLHRARKNLKEKLETGCTLYHDEESELSCDRKD